MTKNWRWEQTMEKTRERLYWIAAVAFLLVVLAAQPVLASDTDVAAPTGFGASYATITSPLTGGGWTGSLAETVYFNGTVYTYVFQVSNSAASITGPVTLSTSTLLLQDNFSSTLNWGVVTGATYLSPGVDDKGDFGGTGFDFGSSFHAFLNADLPKGDVFTFYAQSGGSPTLGTLSGQDGGLPSSGPSLDPGPEPSSILLFGTGIMAFGLVLRRRRQVQST
jgi:PEP-CTERM motif